jgi:hypothetical protein
LLLGGLRRDRDGVGVATANDAETVGSYSPDIRSHGRSIRENGSSRRRNSVGIEPEAEKDLALKPEDAENVTGGRMLKKLKNARKRTAAHPETDIVVNAPPLAGDPADTSTAPQGDDPDC